MLRTELVFVRRLLGSGSHHRILILITILLLALFGMRISEPGQIANNVKNNTVCIRAKGHTKQPGKGTGFVMDKEGHCATAYHVVDGAKKLTVESCKGEGSCSGPANKMLIKKDEELDVAILQLPAKKFVSESFQQINMLEFMTTNLEGEDAWFWTGCSVQRMKKGTISAVTRERKVYLGGVSRMYKGDSGTPVILHGTKLLVGMIRADSGAIRIYDKRTQDTLLLWPEDIELISAESIRKVAGDNPIELETSQFVPSRDVADSATVANVYESVNALEGYMKAIMARKKLMFQDKSQVDLAIQASLEAASFVRRMRAHRTVMTSERAFSIMLYIRGLEAKVTRRDGFTQARDYFELSLQIDSSYAEARYQLAVYNLTYEGDTGWVRDQLTLALTRDPGNPEVVLYLGVLYLITAQYDSAYAYISRADSLLPESDPRVPLLWGVYYDPTWNEEVITPERHPDMNRARVFYAKSIQMEPHFMAPANNLNWTFIRELELDSLGKLDERLRADLIHNLRTGLLRLRPYADWGFRDPRFLETFAHAYAYLSEVAPDEKSREKDCWWACQYAESAQRALKETKLRTRQRDAVEKGVRKVNKTCGCTTGKDIGTKGRGIKDNVVCIRTVQGDNRIHLGTGLILTNDGYCVTPYHVVKGASELSVNSIHYGKDCIGYLHTLLNRVAGEEDVAILKLPASFVDTSAFRGIDMVDSVTEKLEGQPVLVWTGCDEGGFRSAVVSRVFGPNKIYIHGIVRLDKGESGSPVFLQETGQLLGILAATSDPIRVLNTVKGDTLVVYPEDIELVSAESIKALLVPRQQSGSLER